MQSSVSGCAITLAEFLEASRCGLHSHRNIAMMFICILAKPTWHGHCLRARSALKHVSLFFGTYRSASCVARCSPVEFAVISDSPGAVLSEAGQLVITVLPLPVSRNLSVFKLSSGTSVHTPLLESHPLINGSKPCRIQRVHICSYQTGTFRAGALLNVAVLL